MERHLHLSQHKRSRGLLQGLLFALLVPSCLTACVTQTPDQLTEGGVKAHLTLNDLSLERVKASGSLLISLPKGLHALSPPKRSARADRDEASRTNEANEAGKLGRARVVLVHGYASRGYEWVGPALKLAQRGDVYFYRWDWSMCPDVAAEHLISALKSLVDQGEPLEVYGHSYGGVITAVMAARYRGVAPLTVNLIASPLAGHPQLEARCEAKIAQLTTSLRTPSVELATQPSTKPSHEPSGSPSGRAEIKAKVSIKQWRTRKHLDGAFKDLERDPQRVDWRGEVITLPKSYQGRRLGHNWSISWVADQQIKPETLAR